jgi:protein-S-isoprenylcysteine O-methyltransferase Ste14
MYEADNSEGRGLNMKQWKMYILSCIWGPLLVAQIILVFAFGFYNKAGLDAVMYIGLAIWILSAVLGWLPILVLKRKGGVARGESYVKTTVLVDTGIYAVIRHPQAAAGLMWSLALILISQSWIVTALGVVAISLGYVDILIADKHELEKFGDDYKRYMRSVPRINFIVGIIRLLRRRKRTS